MPFRKRKGAKRSAAVMRLMMAIAMNASDLFTAFHLFFRIDQEKKENKDHSRDDKAVFSEQKEKQKRACSTAYQRDTIFCFLLLIDHHRDKQRGKGKIDPGGIKRDEGRKYGAEECSERPPEMVEKRNEKAFIRISVAGADQRKITQTHQTHKLKLSQKMQKKKHHKMPAAKN